MIAKNISVSPNVSTLLPDVMIDYLWKLALSDEYRSYVNQTFILEPAQLGGRAIQDIFHLDNLRRVFGIEPIRCKLRIFNYKGCYQMTLAN